MARPIRVEYEGAVYHVMARGNERKRIYRYEEDRKRFLGTLEEAVQEHGLRVHGYCLSHAFVDEAFGAVVENPWDYLRLGLALGGEEMLERVQRFLQAKPRQEEVRWMTRVERGPERIAAARSLAEEQRERAWQVWVRVRLGMERRIDVARECGYQDGSAITQIVKRLEANAQTQPAVGSRMSRLRRAFARIMSSVKR